MFACSVTSFWYKQWLAFGPATTIFGVSISLSRFHCCSPLVTWDPIVPIVASMYLPFCNWLVWWPSFGLLSWAPPHPVSEFLSLCCTLFQDHQLLCMNRYLNLWSSSSRGGQCLGTLVCYLRNLNRNPFNEGVVFAHSWLQQSTRVMV